jgi:hypothetical protein
MASLLMFKTASIEVLLLEVCPALYAIHHFLEAPPTTNDSQKFPDRLPPRFNLKTLTLK